MKIIFAFGSALVIALTLACAAPEEPAPAEETQSQAAETASPEPAATDGSISAMDFESGEVEGDQEADTAEEGATEATDEESPAPTEGG